MAKTISVVVPNYNHACYLPDSLGAIVEQSLPPKEVIVVDDGSTDDSVGVIETFVRRYPFVRLLRNRTNKGVNFCLRRGLEEASGDYIIFPGADDKILPGLFEKSLALLAEYPQAGICSALALLLGQDGKNLGPYRTAIISKKACFVPPERYLAVYKKYDNWLLTYPAVYKRSAVLEAGGHRADMGAMADAAMIFSIALKHGACFIPEPLAMWRRVPGGYAYETGQDPLQSIKLLDYVAAHAIRPGNPIAEEFLRLWKRRVALMMVNHLIRETPCRDRDVAEVGRHLPAPNLLDRLIFAGTGLYPKIGWWPIKLYLFYNQTFRAKLGIVRYKLSRLWGRPACG